MPFHDALQIWWAKTVVDFAISGVMLLLLAVGCAVYVGYGAWRGRRR